MKRVLQRLSLYTASIVLALSLVPPSDAMAAAASTIKISPATGNYVRGTTFTAQVTGWADASGTSWASMTASGTLNFPAGRLQVVSTSTAGSSYGNMSVTHNNSTGAITFNGTKTQPSASNLTFFSVTFRATTSGYSSLSFATATQVHENWLYGAPSTTFSGAGYTITDPVCPAGQVGTPPNCSTPTCPAGQVGTPPNCSTPVCPAGQVGTPPNCSTPAPPPTPSPTPTPKPTPTPTPTPTPSTPAPPAAPPAESIDAPVVEEALDETTGAENTGTDTSQESEIYDNIRITRYYGAAKLSWKHKIEANTTVRYGLKEGELTKTASATVDEDGTMSATLEGLEPGMRYYLAMEGAATANEITDTHTGSFITRGYPVVLQATKNGTKLDEEASLTLNGNQYKTDKTGVLRLEFAAGEHKGTLQVGSQKQPVSFVVKKVTLPVDNSAPDLQNILLAFASTAEAPKNSSSLWLLIGGGVGLFALLGVVAFFLIRKRHQAEYSTAPDTSFAQIDYAYAGAYQQAAPFTPAAAATAPYSIDQAPTTNYDYVEPDMSTAEQYVPGIDPLDPAVADPTIYSSEAPAPPVQDDFVNYEPAPAAPDYSASNIQAYENEMITSVEPLQTEAPAPTEQLTPELPTPYASPAVEQPTYTPEPSTYHSVSAPADPITQHAPDMQVGDELIISHDTTPQPLPPEPTSGSPYSSTPGVV